MAFDEEMPESRESHPLEVVDATAVRPRRASISPRVEVPRARLLRAHAGEVLLVVLGVGASTGAFLSIRRSERAALVAEFERESQRSFDLVRRELLAATEVVAGYAGHLAVAPDDGCRSRAYARSVNVASRMETFGVPGRVALSEAAHAALGDRVPCEHRGAISMKGVGERATWLVLRQAG